MSAAQAAGDSESLSGNRSRAARNCGKCWSSAILSRFSPADWSAMEPDFWAEGFCGIDARGSADPADWTIAFPTVESYRDEWLRQARQFERHEFPGIDKLAFLYAASRFDRIEIVGDRALAHKKFDGSATTVDGQEVVLRFQSIFHLARIEDGWKIAGFVGYLPNPIALTPRLSAARLNNRNQAVGHEQNATLGHHRPGMVRRDSRRNPVDHARHRAGRTLHPPAAAAGRTGRSVWRRPALHRLSSSCWPIPRSTWSAS